MVVGIYHVGGHVSFFFGTQRHPAFREGIELPDSFHKAFLLLEGAPHLRMRYPLRILDPAQSAWMPKAIIALKRIFIILIPPYSLIYHWLFSPIIIAVRAWYLGIPY
jgi:hypothetical protein